MQGVTCVPGHDMGRDGRDGVGSCAGQLVARRLDILDLWASKNLPRQDDAGNSCTPPRTAFFSVDDACHAACADQANLLLPALPGGSSFFCPAMHSLLLIEFLSRPLLPSPRSSGPSFCLGICAGPAQIFLRDALYRTGHLKPPPAFRNRCWLLLLQL